MLSLENILFVFLITQLATLLASMATVYTGSLAVQELLLLPPLAFVRHSVPLFARRRRAWGIIGITIVLLAFAASFASILSPFLTDALSVVEAHSAAEYRAIPSYDGVKQIFSGELVTRDGNLYVLRSACDYSACPLRETSTLLLPKLDVLSYTAPKAHSAHKAAAYIDNSTALNAILNARVAPGYPGSYLMGYRTKGERLDLKPLSNENLYLQPVSLNQSESYAVWHHANPWLDKSSNPMNKAETTLQLHEIIGSGLHFSALAVVTSATEQTVLSKNLTGGWKDDWPCTNFTGMSADLDADILENVYNADYNYGWPITNRGGMMTMRYGVPTKPQRLREVECTTTIESWVESSGPLPHDILPRVNRHIRAVTWLYAGLTDGPKGDRRMIISSLKIATKALADQRDVFAAAADTHSAVEAEATFAADSIGGTAVYEVVTETKHVPTVTIIIVAAAALFLLLVNMLLSKRYVSLGLANFVLFTSRLQGKESCTKPLEGVEDLSEEIIGNHISLYVPDGALARPSLIKADTVHHE
ncbi:hypothetical protein K493DRAFT_343311 [Basidiobolus meristosporus CBS 931.73]|uniref:Uncharacterized protein n=1 Tax=Basidiobolus meristosporus CBS 931.73 TaxID=1314790 RepID=A0A1Y1VUW0_9FUNG|nr:hypothetical protein K493DRAFT_343311 [Basidiobolus meristosporus CBS 931.73]|eukprot:ORX64806.1 hypothetical protein K493DRAFT_343311 [Basidiobolus meristosporus CBS 931.73]